MPGLHLVGRGAHRCSRCRSPFFAATTLWVMASAHEALLAAVARPLAVVVGLAFDVKALLTLPVLAFVARGVLRLGLGDRAGPDRAGPLPRRMGRCWSPRGALHAGTTWYGAPLITTSSLLLARSRAYLQHARARRSPPGSWAALALGRRRHPDGVLRHARRRSCTSRWVVLGPGGRLPRPAPHADPACLGLLVRLSPGAGGAARGSQGQLRLRHRPRVPLPDRQHLRRRALCLALAIDGPARCSREQRTAGRPPLVAPAPRPRRGAVVVVLVSRCGQLGHVREHLAHPERQRRLHCTGSQADVAPRGRSTSRRR